MKARYFLPSLLTAGLLTTNTLMAAEPVPIATWHAQSLGQALLNMLLFTAVGIVAAIVGFKIFDKCTPGDLAREIIEQKNVAAAILGAAVIIGVCLIVAAAMIG